MREASGAVARAAVAREPLASPPGQSGRRPWRPSRLSEEARERVPHRKSAEGRLGSNPGPRPEPQLAEPGQRIVNVRKGRVSMPAISSIIIHIGITGPPTRKKK